MKSFIISRINSFKIFNILLPILLLIGSSSISLNAQDLKRAVDAWCDMHFNNCFKGRTFIQINEIYSTNYYKDDYGVPYREVRGEVCYKNFLDIPQCVNFRMYVYSNRTYFSKLSWIYNEQKQIWEWQWEEYSRSNY